MYRDHWDHKQAVLTCPHDMSFVGQQLDSKDWRPRPLTPLEEVRYQQKMITKLHWMDYRLCKQFLRGYYGWERKCRQHGFGALAPDYCSKPPCEHAATAEKLGQTLWRVRNKPNNLLAVQTSTRLLHRRLRRRKLRSPISVQTCRTSCCWCGCAVLQCKPSWPSSTRCSTQPRTVRESHAAAAGTPASGSFRGSGVRGCSVALDQPARAS